MLSAVGATVRFVKSRNRATVLQRALDHWRFLNSTVVPEAFLLDIFPEAKGKKFNVSVDIQHHFELPYGERMAVAAIVGSLQPRIVFEFGTYTGSTTALIAESCPADTVIHTLDLPAEELQGTAVSDEDIGARFKGNRPYANKIVQHRSNSRTFDDSSLTGEVDLVYVDGSHEFEDVLHDSRVGMRMLSRTGVMIWDDYQIAAMPVAAALDVLASEIPLRRVFNTRLVVYRQQ